MNEAGIDSVIILKEKEVLFNDIIKDCYQFGGLVGRYLWHGIGDTSLFNIKCIGDDSINFNIAVQRENVRIIMNKEDEK